MRQVAVIASDRREFDGIRSRAGAGTALDLPLRFARSLRWHTPAWGDTEWLLLADGIGAASAQRACAAIPNPSQLHAILSIGYCGATLPRWKAGDLLVASKVTHAASGEDFSCIIPNLVSSPLPTGVILSVDRVVRLASEKHQIGAQGVDALEMEAAAVARFARQCGLPFLAVKAVSDTCDEDLPIDFEIARRGDGSVRIGSLLAQTLARPLTCIPGLGKLAKSARLASNTLGDAMMGISW